MITKSVWFFPIAIAIWLATVVIVLGGALLLSGLVGFVLL